ncbi:DNA topoisomerase 2-associated protein pat1 [Coemansia erecta]|nr:DNA topoisomerase 2-associated protein pat1 [Coemansia erecta]
MTVEEFEAQFKQNNLNQQQQQPSNQQNDDANPLHKACADPETVARRREQRLQRQAALAKYDGMMSRRDKEFIIRIQISQLLTDDPAADDFYSHMFQLTQAQTQEARQAQSVGAADVQGLLGAAPRARGQRSNTMARMQQQVQRIVNEARRRPKVSHVATAGALGRISVNSARNPKQAIEVQQHHDAGHADAGPVRGPAAARRATLRAVEAAYGAVLRMEQQVRAQRPGDAAYADAREQAWAALGAAQPIMAEYPHPLVRFLGVAKGARLVPRLVPHLSVDHVLALTTTIIANFESLDVCRFGSFSLGADATRRDATSLFLHAVMPPALAFLADTPLQIVNGLFALFMERNNVAWVARTRPAQVFLAVVLRRTGALKQAYAESPELLQAAELYAHLFAALRGNVAALFPPPPPPAQMPGPADDVHAWQFLAALAAAASVEQQHVLVAEARGHVLASVQLAKSGRLPHDVAAAVTANVNLFLNALGLDASQVAA